MKKQTPKISYDKESQVMSVELDKTKSIDSDIHGNVVIDYDKRGKAVRVNFYEFNFDAFKNGLKGFGTAILFLQHPFLNGWRAFFYLGREPRNHKRCYLGRDYENQIKNDHPVILLACQPACQHACQHACDNRSVKNKQLPIA